MPATSLAAGRSIFVDHHTLRRTRPLENGFECNVKEEMYRGLGLADMMVALAEVSMPGRRETASQNQSVEDIVRKLASSDGAVHADETYWTLDGERSYFWVHGNEKFIHFQFDTKAR